MSSGTSYNGWPANSDKAAIGVVSSDVFPGGAKAGDVTTVLRYVARQFDARVEPIVGGWCWGYTYKANANNPSQLSCHASGTAIDINAPDHPNGSGGTFTSAQRGQIYAILDEVQGAVSWLEGYDEMHFEICVNAATLAGVAAVLGDAAPPEPEPPKEWDEMASKDEVQAAVTDAINAAVPTIVNDVVASVLRAEEFDLTAGGQDGRGQAVVTGALRAEEFQLSAAQRQALGV